MSNLKENIITLFEETLEERGAVLANKIDDDMILLESGLDSLGFAILVVKLEESLGYDPFTMMKDAVYPTTLGEFVKIYEQHSV